MMVQKDIDMMVPRKVIRLGWPRGGGGGVGVPYHFIQGGLLPGSLTLRCSSNVPNELAWMAWIVENS